MGQGYVPLVHEAVVQELAGVVQPVPHFAEHHSEGLRQGHRVPEVCVVLALALLHQLVRILGLLGVHLLCQCLHQFAHAWSAVKFTMAQ